MTITQKNNIINQITALLAQLIETESAESATASVQASDKPPVMLTVKECAELVIKRRSSFRRRKTILSLKLQTMAKMCRICLKHI